MYSVGEGRESVKGIRGGGTLRREILCIVYIRWDGARGGSKREGRVLVLSFFLSVFGSSLKEA